MLTGLRRVVVRLFDQSGNWHGGQRHAVRTAERSHTVLKFEILKSPNFEILKFEIRISVGSTLDEIFLGFLSVDSCAGIGGCQIRRLGFNQFHPE